MDNKKKAIDKIQSEMKQNKTAYKTAVGKFIIRRCQENEEFSNALLGKEKTLEGCMKDIISKARKMAKNSVAVVEDSKVYQWASDYYMPGSSKTVKAIQEEKPKVDRKPKENKKDKNEIEGQMDLFSML